MATKATVKLTEVERNNSSGLQFDVYRVMDYNYKIKIIESQPQLASGLMGTDGNNGAGILYKCPVINPQSFPLAV